MAHRSAGFNPRPHAGGDLRTQACSAAGHTVFQSTPPRGGRLWHAVDSTMPLWVSIHAPTRGRAQGHCHHLHEVSIHAPTRGATWPPAAVSCFNPRPHAGGDFALSRRLTPRHCAGFNPRPHAGGDSGRALAQDVSIHAPTRGATHWIRVYSQCFNPRPHAGGDNGRIQSAASARFNPRPHAGGDRRMLETRCCNTISCFNPRPHAGGDKPDQVREVSIHAPTRGAAQAKCHSCFNPRPHAGGDDGLRINAVDMCCFNPRPHAGGDWSNRARSVVSIHARGAARMHCFNPRPHAGGDAIRTSGRSRCHLFQSTPPRGGRPASATLGNMAIADCFNPRPHAGGDSTVSPAPAKIASLSPSFQSTPPRGGRPDPDRRELAGMSLFQSTPPRGGRPHRAQATRIAQSSDVSIHAPTRGATAAIRTWRRSWRSERRPCFNPRPHAGGDCSTSGIAMRAHGPSAGFNPRPHAGGCFILFQSTPPRGGRPSYANTLRI